VAGSSGVERSVVVVVELAVVVVDPARVVVVIVVVVARVVEVELLVVVVVAIVVGRVVLVVDVVVVLVGGLSMSCWLWSRRRSWWWSRREHRLESHGVDPYRRVQGGAALLDFERNGLDRSPEVRRNDRPALHPIRGDRIQPDLLSRSAADDFGPHTDSQVVGVGRLRGIGFLHPVGELQFGSVLGDEQAVMTSPVPESARAVLPGTQHQLMRRCVDLGGAAAPVAIPPGDVGGCGSRSEIEGPIVDTLAHGFPEGTADFAAVGGGSSVLLKG